MSAFANRTVLLALTLMTLALMTLGLMTLAGCAQIAPAKTRQPAVDTRPPGVTANSGGDTRGTILYQPGLVPAGVPSPYAAVSDKFVQSQRQKMAWELAEIDLHAHQQAENAYPVPDPASPAYSKQEALHVADHQAQFNAYLLEKYHARFCSQFHVSYSQLALIIQEGRDKNWPMPPVPKE